MKYLFSILLLILLLPMSVSAADSLDGLVAEALKNNPDLKAAESRWHMFERKIIPARSLDDPMLSFAFVNYPTDSFAAGDTPMTGKDFKLSQKFPFPGKLGTKGEIAEQKALWYKGAYDDLKLQLTRKVKDGWYRLFYLDRAVSITNKNISILDDFIRLTETRYQVGTGIQQDVLKAQVERSKLMDQLFTLQQQRKTVQADLDSLLNRPTGTPIETPEIVPVTKVEQPLQELQTISEQKRPLFAAFQSIVDRYKARRKLAKLEYKPDFNIWGGYRFREEAGNDPVDGQDFASIGISINLPIYLDKRDEAVAEADSGIRMALQQYHEFRNRVSFNIHDAFVQMEKDRDLVLLYKTGIVPQADQTFKASLAAYQVGDVEFLSLLDALLKLYSYEMDYYRVLADHERDVARLEAESGLRFMAVEKIDTKPQP
ncbi:TolC family protein [Geothermobacter hydrogeniphilus]|uniref:Outer membrane protein TolC n=1 Tax=Geothermobacter hydrogeniphilus TaxID=1969733 RepID=A0A1X0Y5N0_9BACT|nr:TolC family protein [Geothermobacter hydrogeniphilus]ORJ60501.1 hypothetical protein B5V00_08025 [Geothermobacter hydrogeniphilus]